MSCQDIVQAVIGQDVLLPCTTNQPDKLENSSVFWRNPTGVTVYDIVRNIPELSNQDQRFMDRVSSFPQQYIWGNFSIVLKTVQVADSGRYICDVNLNPSVPEVTFKGRVDLKITREPTKPERTLTPAQTPTVRDGSTTERSTSLSLLLAFASTWRCFALDL